MLPVDEAVGCVMAACRPLGTEQVALAQAHGRVLAEDIIARVTKPPEDVSAMDGYAARAADAARAPVRLRLVGTSQAGKAYAGTLGAGETVRILTGAPMPAGADCVIIQEDVDRDGDVVTAREAGRPGRHVRRAGLDFSAGDAGVRAGTVLGPRAIALTAAMNVPWVRVQRRPRVAILSTGDEIVMPGDPVGAHQIISSNALALAAQVTEAGGEPIGLGIARDTPESLLEAMAEARGADLVVLTGGASVGDHDLVRPVLTKAGLSLDFWRIAMRPGKPFLFGAYQGVPLLGLPGNPVSSLVCGLLFVRPAVHALLGLPAVLETPRPGVLGCDLKANDERQEYLRAMLEERADGSVLITPFDRQDSSMLGTLAEAGALAVRPPRAPAARAGSPIGYIPL
jgi:molybdopterin molybdotransferase